MKSSTLTCLIAALFLGVATLRAQEPPDMPKPTKEHEWLAKFIGEWEGEIEAYMAPGQPPIKGKGSETSRTVGGFWVVGEGKGEMMGMKFASVLTLGYDPEKKKYTGTWIDSMASYLWKYEGFVEGNTLTLETEGPSPMKPGTTCKFREVTEFKGKDERVFTSSILGDDGKWVKMMTVTFHRKK